MLRDNSHIKNFEKWLSDLMDNYDNWTSVSHLTKCNPVSFFLLKEDQYIADIIADLYWKKEQYACYTTCNEDSDSSNVRAEGMK